jgi:hypothetical protein
MIQPDMILLNTFLFILSLYPCLYKMISVSRYPLIEFGYGNLHLLGNELESCQRIIEMLQDLITVGSNDLRSLQHIQQDETVTTSTEMQQEMEKG